jgi:hypothetical protein
MYMKLKYILGASLALGLCTSCIDETTPKDDSMIDRQVQGNASAMSALTTGIVEHLIKVNTVYGGSDEYDMGYPGLGMTRDMYTSDFPIYNTTYDYFTYWEEAKYLGGDYAPAYIAWNFYYQMINNTHSILRLTPTEDTKAYFGIAHYYRAMAYLDMARLYEYKKTGDATNDAAADKDSIYGLTVPIITESTTEAEASNTPRATFYDMYRFILDDLDTAEEYLADYTRTTKDMPNLSVVYGLKARLYLELGTRFEQNPDDVTTVAESGVDLGASTAVEAYNLAASYADKAITTSGATPLTESEWYGGNDYTTGFNTKTVSSWLLGVAINKEDLSDSEWRNFTGHMSSEQFFGVGGIYYNSTSQKYSNLYGAQHLIGASLYKSISDLDWRKSTWISPDDAGKESAKSKYKTKVADGHFAALPAYASFKFRPGSGEATSYSTGAAVDYPLMRVEEMYFIRIEAKAAAGDLATAKSELQSFMNTYRYNIPLYVCRASDLESFRTELMLQKRIEFWGEGIIAFDYKRLNMQVVRTYDGSNFPSNAQIDSNEGYCAKWLNLYIPNTECGRNAAIKPNPDPSH